MNLSTEIADIVRDTLRTTVEVHKRRVAIAQGNVEPATDGCSHEAWNDFKQWCNSCGTTAEDIFFGRVQPGSRGG